LSPSHARGRAFIQAAHRVDRVSWESQVKHDLQELVLVEHEGAGKVDSQHVDVLVCCPGIFERHDDGLCLLHGR
jgi:hypothetical protein